VRVRCGAPRSVWAPGGWAGCKGEERREDGPDAGRGGRLLAAEEAQLADGLREGLAEGGHGCGGGGLGRERGGSGDEDEARGDDDDGAPSSRPSTTHHTPLGQGHTPHHGVPPLPATPLHHPAHPRAPLRAREPRRRPLAPPRRRPRRGLWPGTRTGGDLRLQPRAARSSLGSRHQRRGRRGRDESPPPSSLLPLHPRWTARRGQQGVLCGRAQAGRQAQAGASRGGIYRVSRRAHS